jgi:hypothetical protein
MTSMAQTLQAESAIFSVNFIRHRVIPRRVRTTFMYAVLAYLLVNAVVLLYFVGSALSTNLHWRRLQTSLQGQASSASTMTGLRQEMGVLHDRATEDLAKLRGIAELKRQRFPLAGRLAVLTTTLPARTWITGVSASRDARLMTIEASYLVDSEAPYELPMKSWLEALRTDAYFRHGLKRLELSKSTRKTQGRSELFTAELVAEWHPNE